MIDLYRGDCLEVMDELIAKGVMVDAIVTDPPFNTTACHWDKLIPFEPMWEQLNRIIKPNGAIVLFGSEPFSSALRMSNIKNYRYDWKWLKEYSVGFMNANKMPLKSYEDVLVFYNRLPTYNPQGLTEINKKTKRKKDKSTTVYNDMRLKEGRYIQKFTNYPKDRIMVSKEKTIHPTQKPVALMEYLIKTYTNENELVLDFTMGSGTTGVACKNLNRNFIGIELEKEYYDIAVERINSEGN